MFGHTKIDCAQCYPNHQATWGRSHHTFGAGSPPKWRIENTPAIWGSANPCILVLGFSRGSNQSHDRQPFDQVAFHGMRSALTRILRRLDLLAADETVDARIRDGEADMAFGSLIRCSIAQYDERKQGYAKSGGAILQTCLKDADSARIVDTCARRHLATRPERLRLVIVLGNEDRYIAGCRSLVTRLHPGVRPLNAVAYGDDQVTWVHVIHAKAQGRHVPDWLEQPATASPLGHKRDLAIAAVKHALA